ncbi:hypothetical protein C8J57DRAFT_1441190 [Mycena rebaudengoi]|nr:hypothetical protein C8J57DRAFT_1441190 [Mycena rebaudengoi]
MEDERGVERGSYIWGRRFLYMSVHNTRIERLWYDVTHGFGQKWKKFFTDLEVNHGLNPTVASHIWLLHHLFLPAINTDAQEWADAWNSHSLNIRRERARSPRDIFLFSMYRAEPADEPVEDITTHGIDWAVADDPLLMNHLLAQNPQDWEERNPFAPGLDTLSHVPCDAPDSPFDANQIAWLDARLAERVDLTSRNMNIRRLVWKEAMEICMQFYQ